MESTVWLVQRVMGTTNSVIQHTRVRAGNCTGATVMASAASLSKQQCLLHLEVLMFTLLCAVPASLD
jgi:hypothetical protein